MDLPRSCWNMPTIVSTDWLDNGFEFASFDHVVAVEDSDDMVRKHQLFDEMRYGFLVARKSCQH